MPGTSLISHPENNLTGYLDPDCTDGEPSSSRLCASSKIPQPELPELRPKPRSLHGIHVHDCLRPAGSSTRTPERSLRRRRQGHPSKELQAAKVSRPVRLVLALMHNRSLVLMKQNGSSAGAQGSVRGLQELHSASCSGQRLLPHLHPPPFHPQPFEDNVK